MRESKRPTAPPSPFFVYSVPGNRWVRRRWLADNSTSFRLVHWPKQSKCNTEAEQKWKHCPSPRQESTEDTEARMDRYVSYRSLAIVRAVNINNGGGTQGRKSASPNMLGSGLYRTPSNHTATGLALIGSPILQENNNTGKHTSVRSIVLVSRKKEVVAECWNAPSPGPTGPLVEPSHASFAVMLVFRSFLQVKNLFPLTA